MKRFLNNVIPKEHESIYSILHRTAKANYFQHLGTMLAPIKHDVYFRNCNYFAGNRRWTEMFKENAQRVGINPEMFILNKYDIFLRHPEILKVNYVYNKINTVYCPECLVHDYYHRLFWDVTFVSFCPIHHKILIDSCPRCKKKITLASLMTKACDCGCYFDQASANWINNPYVLEAQLFLFKVLHNENNIVQAGPFKGTPSDYFYFFYVFWRIVSNLEDISFVDKISAGAIKKVEMPSKIISTHSRTLTNAVVHQLISSDTLDFFTELFSLIQKQQEGTRSRKQRLLKLIFDHPRGGFHKEVYKDFLKKATSFYINEKNIVKLDVKEKRFLNAEESMKYGNFSYSRLLQLCNEGTLAARKVDINGRLIRYFEKDSLDEYKNWCNNFMSKKSVIKLYGTTWHVLDTLNNMNLLCPSHCTNQNGLMITFYSKETVYHFKKALFTKEKQRSSINRNEWLNIQDAQKKIWFLGQTFGVLLQGIIENQILAVWINPDFRNIYVHKEELFRYIKGQLADRFKNKGYMKDETARILRVRTKRVKQLIYNGTFTVTQFKERGHATEYISREQIELFLSSYNDFDKSVIKSELDNFLFTALKKKFGQDCDLSQFLRT